MRSLKKCLSDIKHSKNIAIFTHMIPDADALASAVALKKLIKSNLVNQEGEQIVDIFFDYDEIGETNSVIIKGVVHNYQRCNTYDLGIALDCASKSRLGKYEELFDSCANKINIDHHLTNDNYADNNLIFKTSSTCEALYIVAQVKGYEIPDDVCSLIYSGIITDTNNLSQGNITINTHKIIAELLERNINLDALNEHFFKNNAVSKAMLLKKALQSLRFYDNDRLAIMKLTSQDLASVDANFDDTVGIVDHGIGIKGVDIAVLIIKKDDNSYYVSLRGKNNINVANIATSLGGGGHEHMSAFQYEDNYNAMFDKLMQECQQELEKNSPENTIESLFAGDDDDDNI